jgi:hypothetical protein
LKKTITNKKKNRQKVNGKQKKMEKKNRENVGKIKETTLIPI